MWRLIQQKGVEWLQTHVTKFADDFHACWSGNTECSLHRAVKEVAEILSLLEGFGFQLNLQKSFVTIKVSGKRASAFNKNYVVRRTDGVFLKSCSRDGKTFKVPIVARCDYLGAVLSYTHFERDTVARRVKAADYAYSRLKQVLGCRRQLSLKQRLEVYDTCVLSTLRHGIFTAGFGTSEARAIHALIMRHLRFIACSPRHITHESNEHLCARLDRLTPLAWLRHTWEGKSRSWQLRRTTLDTQDIVMQTPCPQFGQCARTCDDGGCNKHTPLAVCLMPERV